MYAMVGCFLWGIVSTIFSPCHLASIPLLVSYAAGQKMQVHPRNAVGYAICFSFGLFLAIALLGIICALLGTMLGDVPRWIPILIGIFLICMGVQTALRKNCDIAYGLLFKYTFTGYSGAGLLGLLYGFLSGVCTFGFLAPVLSLITIQQKFLQGIVMTFFFAAGHCLPIAVIGSGVSFFDVHGYTRASTYLKKGACVLIILFGIYFIISAL